MFWGEPPILAPKSVMFPKMSTSLLPMAPFLGARVPLGLLFYSKDEYVCKKTELNMLRVDQDVKNLNLKK